MGTKNIARMTTKRWEWGITCELNDTLTGVDVDLTLDFKTIC